MKRSFKILLILLAGVFGIQNRSEAGDLKNSLIRDLRNENFSEQKLFNLSGDWGFYWNKLVYPEDLDSAETSGPDLIIKVPSYWSGYQLNGKELSRFGYGTYQLIILLPPGHTDTLALQIPVFDASYDFWMNDKKIASNGKVGKTESESRPEYRRISYTFLPESDTLNLLIHVSNFYHRRGGFWKNLYLGTSSEIRSQNFRSKTTSQYSQAILLAFALFFLIFQVLLQRDRVMIYFALTLLGIYIRSLCTDFYNINQFISISWENMIRAEYISTYLAYIFGAWYLFNLFPSQQLKKVIYLNCILMLGMIILVLTSHVPTFAYTSPAFQAVSVLLFIYFLIRSFIGMIRKNLNDTIYFISFVIIIFGEVHDFLLSLSVFITFSDYIMPYVLLIFAFIQAGMLIAQWVNSLKTTERLHLENKFINENLEELVKTRTNELNEKNRQLEANIELKNRLFSIIAHDLKSPIASLQQYTDLMLSDETVKKRRAIMLSLKQMISSVVDLIDNLILWGMSQGKQIKYSPQEVELIKLVNAALRLQDENANLKEVWIENHLPPTSLAWCDPQLVEICLRNLLTNAIKFTDKGGSVHIKSSYSEDGRLIKIAVEDSGVGIPDKKLAEINAGEKIESAPGTSNEKGTGLGLSLVRDLMKINKGKLEITSSYGKGTTAILYLPVHE